MSDRLSKPETVRPSPSPSSLPATTRAPMFTHRSATVGADESTASEGLNHTPPSEAQRWPFVVFLRQGFFASRIWVPFQYASSVPAQLGLRRRALVRLSPPLAVFHMASLGCVVYHRGPHAASRRPPGHTDKGNGEAPDAAHRNSKDHQRYPEPLGSAPVVEYEARRH